MTILSRFRGMTTYRLAYPGDSSPSPCHDQKVRLELAVSIWLDRRLFWLDIPENSNPLDPCQSDRAIYPFSSCHSSRRSGALAPQSVASRREARGSPWNRQKLRNRPSCLIGLCDLYCPYSHYCGLSEREAGGSPRISRHLPRPPIKTKWCLSKQPFFLLRHYHFLF